MAITYQEIEKAAFELQSQRKSVTGDNIREVLGTGSKGTITKYLRQWRVNNGVKTVDESSVPPHLLQIVRDLWNQIESDATDKITEHKETIEKKLSGTQLLLETCKSQNAQLTQEHGQLKTDLNKSENANQALRDSIDTVQKKQIISNERITALESHNAEYKNEIARLHQLLKESQAQTLQLNETLTCERKVHASSMDSLRNDNEKKITAIQSELSKSQIENAALKSNINHLSQSNTKLEHELVSFKEAHQFVVKNHDELQKENTSLKNQLSHEKDNITAFSEKLENKNSENTNLMIQLKTNENLIHQSMNTISKLENVIKTLQEKQEVLMREKYQLESNINTIRSIEEVK